MNVFLIGSTAAALVLSSCQPVGVNKCATPLTYQTDPFSAGSQAIYSASNYAAYFPIGNENFFVKAIVDTSSANLVINESAFDFSTTTATGDREYRFDNGYERAIAINAKDQIDIACSTDIATRFSLTTSDVKTKNYVGLAYSDPSRHPQEGTGPSFFDQLVGSGKIRDVFSLALCGQRGNSRLVIGGIDDSMINRIGNFIPVIERSGFVVPAKSLKTTERKTVIGEFPKYDPVHKTGKRTIIDSSSAFLLLPPEMAIEVAKQVATAANGLGLSAIFPDGFFRTERSNATRLVQFFDYAQIRQFPSFDITFEGTDGKDRTLEISPLHYFKEMDTEDPMIRTFAIRESPGDVVLGQPFLENHYVFVDRQNGRIGFGNIDVACLK